MTQNSANSETGASKMILAREELIKVYIELLSTQGDKYPSYVV